MVRTLLYVFAFCYCVCSLAQNLFESNYIKNKLEPNPSLIKETNAGGNLTTSNTIKNNFKENNNSYNSPLDDLKNNNWCNYINLLSTFILCAIFVLLISTIFI